MQATRRFWATAMVGVVFSLLVLGGAHQTALFGTIGIGTWLLATAWTATQTFQRLGSDLTVEYTVDPPTTQVGSSATATLTVIRPPDVAATPLRVSVSLPPGLQLGPTATPAVTLSPGETAETIVIPIETTVAGEFALPDPVVELADRRGLYTETLAQPADAQVTVLPPEPTVHIGKGGEAYGNAFGEHPTDRPGPGIAVRELRQYLAGEDAMNIDWKSTARLGEPYVRETEGETDRHTALLVDHRAETGQSAGTETPFEYIREAALGITSGASEAADPLSLRTIGDNGITNTIAPGSTPTTYSRVQATLLALSPPGTAPTRGWPQPARELSLGDQIPAESTFAHTLRPYVAATTHRIEGDDSFVTAVQRTRNEFGTGAWFVLITTDANPVQLQESVKIATTGGANVLVLVVPTVLFETEGIETIAETYAAYSEFEELRQTLDAHPRVTALELAPGDRLQSVLSHGRAAQTATESN